jgi:alkanesulfonate monooxygenase SsuD/methylene tetrahydromethanopterin reductase-like flavin-dependent oxidoreductase (luciferase family)
MKFGITPTSYFWDDFQKFTEWCVKVEEMGFDAILVPDHYQFPVPPFYSNSLFEAWTTLSYVSAKTSKIRLGSLVSPIPRYIPSQLAKVIASVDLLSNGRTIAGFGIGYCPDEFVNYSPTFRFEEPKVLFEKFKEGLEIIIKLWENDKVTFKGKYYTLTEAVLLPKPLQKPRPPLLIGGVGRRTLKIAAEFFDYWVPPVIPQRISTLHVIRSTEEYEGCKKIIQEHLKHFKRETSGFTFGVLLRFSAENNELVREATNIIERYRSVGCQYVVIEFSHT